LGFAAYLCKPVSQSELLEVVSSALRNAGKNRTPEVAQPIIRREGQSLHVLLAEDNVVNQTLASHLLEKRGFEVTVVGDGNAALGAIDREKFDVVLMDIQMPIKDGLETTGIIRANEAITGKHLPIIALTAHAMKGDRERCLEAGMDAYISKPIRSKELFAAIENLVQGTVKEAASAAKAPAPNNSINSSVFNEALLLERTEGSAEICALLVETFLKECPTHVAGLRAALQQKDARQLAVVAHGLKGAVANFTDGAALQATKALETTGKQNDLKAADEAFRNLLVELDRLQSALSEFSHRQQGLKAGGSTRMKISSQR
jgi:CheY-like chemotaxis protein